MPIDLGQFKKKKKESKVKISLGSQDKKVALGRKSNFIVEKIPEIQTKTDKLHILTKKNIIHFIQEEKRTKLYEMRIRFYKNSLNEIDMLIKKLFQENKLTKNKNGWISLKR